MSDNWIVNNLENALETWNSSMGDMWGLLTKSPQEFKNGEVWSVILTIHDAVIAVGIGLLVLFFVFGVVKTCSNFAEVKRIESVFKMFIRFVLAQAVVTHGLELMLMVVEIVQGLISTVMTSAGMSGADNAIIPESIITAIEETDWLNSILLWAVTLIGGLVITVLSFVMIMSVYGRFFKVYSASGRIAA